MIKIPVDMEVSLIPGIIVLDGHPAPLPEKGHTPSFRSMCIVATRLPISATAEHLLYQHVWSGTLVPREHYGGAVYTAGMQTAAQWKWHSVKHFNVCNVFKTPV